MGMKSVFCVIFSLFAAVGVSARAEGIDVTSGNFESYRALKDGNTYRFVESVTFAAPSGESALKVADGATVTLNIPSGVTVTLTGGSANGVTGAGAGIEVPASATLNIIGAGKLIAYGGDAASGTDGEQGTTPASYNDSTAQSTAASGGAGGNGGGGAGAGIGGHGGNGGNGGNGGESFTDKWNAYERSGNSGTDGAAGSNGGSCGTVVIHETVTVFAIGGAAGANGSGGDEQDWCPNTGKTYYWAAYGSGGGGGGGGGSSASDIGGGGAGGGGAGGGGGGGLSYSGKSSAYNLISYKKNGLGGEGGVGGDGSSSGGKGKDRAGELVTYDGTTAQTETKYDDDENHYSGGAGGSGGAAGKRGDNGSATVKDSAVAIAEEVGYSVGRISDTEYIFWKQGKLYRVKDGGSTNMTYTVVTENTDSMDSNKWYVVKGMVSRSKIGVNGTANLVLLNGASITVQGGKYEPGILVSLGNTLNIFGTETGSLTVQGGDLGAGIGGGNRGAGGEVTINGGSVTATGGSSGAGIGGGHEGAGGEVTINGGTVTATGGNGGAGIGGGNRGAGGEVKINGGEVTAQGGVHGAGIGGGQEGKGGTITVNGGTVTATGGDLGAGIGGGWHGDGGTVIINGGEVTAQGGKYGAGIGGGQEGKGGTITVNGGTVTATGGEYGAGIGGGEYGAGGEVMINGGTVTATGGSSGAGIGGGNEGAGGEVTINGGTVTATGGSLSTGIGGGYNGAGGSLTLGSRVFKIDDGHYREGVEVCFEIPSNLRLASALTDGGPMLKMSESGASRTALLLSDQHLILTFETMDFKHRLTSDAVVSFGPFSSDTVIDASQLPKVMDAEKLSVDYALPTGGVATATDAVPLYSTGQSMSMGQSNWYVVTGTVTAAAIEVKGNVNLILADGAKLTVNGGIRVDYGNEFTVYGQREGTGELVANGAAHCAGIGGQNPKHWAGYGSCGTVIINGGTVTATGGSDGAGIGGGYEGAGGEVTINGGTVTATGGDYSAGIGGGMYGAGGEVTINGGTVTAQGGSEGAGIGGGYKGAGGTVTINGGTVTAIGRDGGRGIGGGNAKGGGAVSITGGTVRAEGWDALGETVVLGDNVFAYDITGGEPGTLITEETLLTSVDKILAVYDAPVGPTCEGGTIAEVGGTWVVAPNTGVTALTIAGLPEGAKLAVKCGDYSVPSAAFVGFGEDGKTFSLALNPDGVVDGVPVKPTIGNLNDGDPFVVGETGVEVTIKTIPGLVYELKRTDDLGSGFGSIDEGIRAIGDGNPVKLIDNAPPPGQAFYIIDVSTP